MPLPLLKKLTDATSTRTVLPSLCTFNGEAGFAGFHRAYQS